MKNQKDKLSKKKILICITALLISAILIPILCSFSFRTSVYQTSVGSLPSIEAVQNMVSILSYQADMNGLSRGSNILVLYGRTSGSYYYLAAVVSSADSFTVSVNDDEVTCSFSPGYQYIYNNSTGFYGGTSQGSITVNSSLLFYSSMTIPETSIPSFTGFNQNASFGYDNFNTHDVLNYYQYIYDSALYREERESMIRQEAQSEGESIGFDAGAEEGYEVGLEQGYEQGYDSGFSDGEDRGYSNGYDIGYETGYESGYTEGESIGYNDGYHDGFDTGMDWGYQFGYEDGYETGIQTGRAEGIIQGKTQGYAEGYDEGYTDGFNDGSEDPEFDVKCTFYKQEGTDLATRENLYYNQNNEWPLKYVFINFTTGTIPLGYEIYTFTDVIKRSQINNIDQYKMILPDFFNEYFPDLVVDDITITQIGDTYEAKVRLSENDSYAEILEKGYNQGYQNGIKDVNAITDGIGSMAAAPIDSLRSALDFEIFGVNMGLVIIAIIVLLFVFFIWRFIKKILPI